MDVPLPLVEAPAAPPPRRVAIGRLAVDPVTMTEAVERIDALVAAGNGGAVYTPNVDHVVLCERHLVFREAYARVSLCLTDGMPIVWASRLLGEPVPEKVSGSDLVLPLARRAASRGWRVYLLGGGPGVAEEVAARLRERFEGLRVVGTDSPRVDADGHEVGGDRALQAVLRTRPDLVLVALGTPKQELWIHHVRDRLRPAVIIGVGASFDFITGRARRAPRWVSRAGLEWAWRLAHEPRRLWRRYLVDDRPFFGIVARDLRARRRAARGR